MVYHPEDDNEMLEYEADVGNYVFEHWFNLEFFHDYIFGKADDYEPANQNMKVYLNHANYHDRLHTNDSITPTTFVWLLSIDEIDGEWTSYLRQRYLNEE